MNLGVLHPYCAQAINNQLLTYNCRNYSISLGYKELTNYNPEYINRIKAKIYCHLPPFQNTSCWEETREIVLKNDMVMLWGFEDGLIKPNIGIAGLHGSGPWALRTFEYTKKFANYTYNLRDIPNCIDTDLFNTNITQYQARQYLNLPLDKKIVGMIGRYTLVKRPELLVQHINNFPDNWIALFVNMYLEGNDRCYFRGYDKSYITLRALDVLLVLSLHEGDSRITKEAMSCNIPVVSTIDQPDVIKLDDINDIVQKVTQAKQLNREIILNKFSLKHYKMYDWLEGIKC